MGHSELGPKARQLQTLEEAGLNVPAFVAFANAEMSRKAGDLAKEAAKELGTKRYAVRSSSFSEDRPDASMAGQFKTVLDVEEEGLEGAIDAVRDDAREKLGDLKKFSLIIQEYVRADVSGVAFTRDPSGGRETVIEWVKGPCEALVSGEKTPERFAYVRSQETDREPFRGFSNAREAFLRIERLFDAPQDIEWGMRGKELVIFQSRPITTLSKEQLEVIAYLDEHLPDDEPFLYEKTGVSDVAPRPTPFTLSLLRRLYVDGGPVAHAYADLGVAYEDTDPIVIVGNELYVDREAELKAILPNYTVLGRKRGEPSPEGFGGFGRAAKNRKALASMGISPDELADAIGPKLVEVAEAGEFNDALSAFLRDYELVFTANLAAEQAMRALERSLPKDVALADALAMDSGDDLPAWEPLEGLVGNTLELTDHSRFAPAPQNAPKEPLARKVDADRLWAAQFWQRMREYGRWLAISRLTTLRKAAGKDAAWLTVEEVASGDHPGKDEIMERKQAHADGNAFTFPRMLSDRPMDEKGEGPIGVSAGKAAGVVVTENGLKKKGKKILLVESLRPGLADVAGEVEGMISASGGMLSHFAIIAREMGLPVIVGADLSKVPEGKEIEIDGGTGEIIVR